MTVRELFEYLWSYDHSRELGVELAHAYDAQHGEISRRRVAQAEGRRP